MDVEASVVRHLDMPGIQGIDAGADGLEAIVGHGNSVTRINIDCLSFARSDLAVLDANPLRVPDGDSMALGIDDLKAADGQVSLPLDDQGL
jgi:hypothetical protein